MKKFKQYQDVIAGIVFLLVSSVYFSSSFFETSGIMQVKYGPDFMPKIYAVLMALLSAALIITGLNKAGKYKETGEDVVQADKKSVQTVMASFLLVAGYIYLIKSLGFLMASVLYLFGQAWLLSQKKNYPVLLLFSIVGAVAIYLLFAKAIGLLLPKGIFGF